MNEISVVVSQEPGKVTWNFEEIKQNLESSLVVFQNTIYDDETIKSAKSDLAYLRSLSKSIEDRRKEIKVKCLEAYEPIERQAKELVTLINKPVDAINTQVQDYENRRREKVRAEINAYWTQQAVQIPEELLEKAYSKIYDSRWENATATKKSWKEGIDKGISEIVGAIETIKSFNSEFEKDALEVYERDLSLQDAIRKMNELKAQKERILEAERERIRREAEAAEKAAAKNEQAVVENLVHEAVKEPERQATPVHTPRVPDPEPCKDPEMAYPHGVTANLVITGTEEQISKIKKYIEFTGATFREM